MSKDNKPTRRGATPPPIAAEPTVAQRREPRRATVPPATPAVHDALLFESKNYQFFAVGILLIIAGFFLMSGGGMDNPNEWDESKIYSFQRITLAPIVVLSGIGVVIYGLFFRAPQQETKE